MRIERIIGRKAVKVSNAQSGLLLSETYRRINMQTKLRTIVLVFAASLLSASMISAASQAKKASPAARPKSHFVGIASWYGLQHQGLKMANGQRFDRRKLTAASWYVPLGTVVRVINLENGKSVTVTVTDRGPNFRLNRVLDLSEAAARELDYVGKGLTPVLITPMLPNQPEHAKVDAALVEPLDADLVATYAAPLSLPLVP
jgi:rare lipoprotein A